MNYITYWKDGLQNITRVYLNHPVNVLNEISLPGEEMPRLVERVVVTLMYSDDKAPRMIQSHTTLHLDEEMTG